MPARIVIAVERANSEIQIEVRDNGPGIPSEIVPRIFDPFFTTKDAVHGVGLGLFVAEGLVRAAGGRITAGQVSATAAGGKHDHGAWFRIELPTPPALPDMPTHHAHISA